MPLEEMGEFFNSRLEHYENHMLGVEGLKDAYKDIAGLIPSATGLKLLDLGCGTGLELDEIFRVNPSVQVTGIDMADKMLKQLRRKHASRKSQLNLIYGNYLKTDFGIGIYDVALSCESFHHFTHEVKTELYRRIHASLKPDGFYIELDYIATDQELEDNCYVESERIHAEEAVDGTLYHSDTPNTLENLEKMLQRAGFRSVKVHKEYGQNALLTAKR